MKKPPQGMITVRELVKALLECPQDSAVVLSTSPGANGVGRYKPLHLVATVGQAVILTSHDVTPPGN